MLWPWMNRTLGRLFVPVVYIGGLVDRLMVSGVNLAGCQFHSKRGVARRFKEHNCYLIS